MQNKIFVTAAGCLIMLLLQPPSGGLVAVQANIDVSNINVNNLAEHLPANLASNIKLDEAKTLFKEKCIKVAGEEQGQKAYEEIENATLTLGECITNLANVTAIQQEIEDAKPRGDLDVVFNKYCKKRPDALACAETFNEKLIPCLDKDEQANKEVFMRIVRSLLDFVCHKGGDQIALFIAERGPECLESKRDDIEQCLNKTFTVYMPKEGLNKMDSIPKLVMGAKQCDELMQLETCIVQHLEHCDEITPANIVESMFRFIKNETICRSSSSSRLTADHQSHAANNASAAGYDTCSATTLCALMLAAFLLPLLTRHRQ